MIESQKIKKNSSSFEANWHNVMPLRDRNDYSSWPPASLAAICWQEQEQRPCRRQRGSLNLRFHYRMAPVQSHNAAQGCLQCGRMQHQAMCAGVVVAIMADSLCVITSLWFCQSAEMCRLVSCFSIWHNHMETGLPHNKDMPFNRKIEQRPKNANSEALDYG